MPRNDLDQVLSVNNDNMSKKAITQRDVLSERQVIPPETSPKNEDILDMMMKNDKQRVDQNLSNFQDMASTQNEVKEPR